MTRRSNDCDKERSASRIIISMKAPKMSYLFIIVHRYAIIPQQVNYRELSSLYHHLPNFQRSSYCAIAGAIALRMEFRNAERQERSVGKSESSSEAERHQKRSVILSDRAPARSHHSRAVTSPTRPHHSIGLIIDSINAISSFVSLYFLYSSSSLHGLEKSCMGTN